jgi:hypothetical protein
LQAGERLSYMRHLVKKPRIRAGSEWEEL